MRRGAAPSACPSLLLALALPLAAAPAAAQEVRPDLDGFVPIDRVIATVNDAVILQREILALSRADEDGLAAELGQPLQPQERRLLFLRNLERKIDQHAMAQAAKTLGILPPDRVETILQEELRADELAQERELGTYQKVSEERARQHATSSWQAIENEQRVAKLAELTQGMTVSLRLQNQRNLFITPAMMREHYRRNRGDFVHAGRARLGSVAFLGAGREQAAADAATVWQREALSPEQLVARFADRGACAPDQVDIDENSRKTRRPEQVDFALAGPKDRVSAPVVGDDNVRLWKVLEYVGPRNDAFDDPEVQRQIRLRLERLVIDDLMHQALVRSRLRTEVWYAPGVK